MSTPFARRSYFGGAPTTTVPLALSSTATGFDVADGTAYPFVNFFCVLDIGTSTEEKIFVGARSGNTFTEVLRGEDGTTGKAHVAGATVHHIGAAQDFDEANLTATALTTKGDVLVKAAAPGPTRLPVGADTSVLTADSGTSLGLSWQPPVPAGSVFSTVAVIAPAGYLFLDGSTVTDGQTLYPNLWAVIPAPWKVGTDIHLPDARGRTLVGAGTGAGLTNRALGSTFGEENHVLTGAELAGHDHGGATGSDNAFHGHSASSGVQSANHTHAMAGYTPQNFQNAAAGVDFYAARDPWTPADGIQTGIQSADHTHSISVVANNAPHTHGIPTGGANPGHNNMQPSIALSWIIKT